MRNHFISLHQVKLALQVSSDIQRRGKKSLFKCIYSSITQSHCFAFSKGAV